MNPAHPETSSARSGELSAAQFEALLGELRAAGHLSHGAPMGEYADPAGLRDERVSRPILVLQGLGGWLAALLLLLGIMPRLLAWDPAVGMALAGAVTLAAGRASHGARHVFMRQFLLSWWLAGQLAFAALATAQWWGGDVWWLVAGFELVVGLGTPARMQRRLAVAAACGASMAALAFSPVPEGGGSVLQYGLLPAQWAASCLLWAGEARWRTCKAAPLLGAVAEGLTLYCLPMIVLAASLSGVPGLDGIAPGAHPVAIAALSMTSFLCLGHLGREAWRSARGVVAPAGLAVGVAVLWQAPAVSAGVATMTMGFAGGRRWMVAYGGVAALLAFGLFYHWLGVDLLAKSVCLALGGFLLLGVRWWMRRQGAQATAAGAPRARQVLRVVAGLVLVLGAASWNIYENENILAQGRIVRLQLAPVDPRSLMQGDYMALAYSVQRELREEDPGGEGFVVLRLDDRNVGSLVRTQPRVAPLAANEVALRYRVRKDNRAGFGRDEIRFATNAFFFQEGTGERYAQARYGEFRVGANGEPRLVALLDADLQRLGSVRR